MNVLVSELLSISKPQEHSPPPALLMQRILHCFSRGGWKEICSSLFMQQRGLLLHISVGMLLFFQTSGDAPGNWEVCSHVPGLVRSVAVRLNSYSGMFTDMDKSYTYSWSCGKHPTAKFGPVNQKGSSQRNRVLTSSCFLGLSLLFPVYSWSASFKGMQIFPFLAFPLSQTLLCPLK